MPRLACFALAWAALLIGWPSPAAATQEWICGSPPESWLYGEEFSEAEVVNRISVAGPEALRWNGEAVTRETLWDYLRRSGATAPPPFTLVEFNTNADCALVQEVREAMARELACDTGSCREARIVDPPLPTGNKADVLGALEEAAEDLNQALEEAEAATRGPG